MRANEFLKESKQTDLMSVLRDFLPLALQEIGLDGLPPIKLQLRIEEEEQPTFGKFVNDEGVIYLAIEDRHPLDIIRTLAHELVHFKQGIEHRLNDLSGETGSPEENEAHEVAGIVMRNFNKKYPQYFKASAVNVKEGAVSDLKKDLKNPRSYDAIDHMMQTIARKHGITAKELHDKFVKATGKIPDDYK